MTNIIISGASGLIGTALLNLLKNNTRHKITGIYRNTEPAVKGANISYRKCDLTKKNSWHDLKDMDAYGLIHCAAKIPGAFGGSESGEARRVNSEMDGCAVSYAKEKNIRLIYISSSSVYGMVTRGISKEDSGLNPLDEYARGKSESENRITNEPGLSEYFILRVSAPYGPFQRNKTVLKIFIKNALADLPLLYYGSGSRMQDFIYVKDVGRACMAALESRNFGIYNIAGGNPVSIKDLAHLVKKLTGSRCRIRPADIEDPQESYRGIFDISKAIRSLGWRPVYPLKKGLEEFIEHIRKNES